MSVATDVDMVDDQGALLQTDPGGGLPAIFADIFVNPTRGFARMLAQPRWTLAIPLILVIGCTLLINIFYYHNVDLVWLGQQLTNGMSLAQRDLTLRSMSVGRLVVVSIVGVTLLTVLIDLARTLFFWLVLKIRGQSRPFSALLAVTTWSGIPLLLLLPAGFVNIALAHGGHLAPNDVNPVSINQILLHLPSWTGFGRMLSTISIVSLWELLLLALGLKVAAGISMRAAVAMAMVPDLVAYGVWTILIVGASGGAQ